MPQSKVRSKAKPRAKRDKARVARARATQAAQAKAEARKASPASYKRRRVLGWTLVALGVVVFVQHLISHAGFFVLVSPGVDDLIAGYPLAGLLGLAGVLLLSRT
jgi:hypothetical protein